MLKIFLIRHGYCENLGVALNGRQPKVFLTTEGISQAEKLAFAFDRIPLDLICSSPLERTLQTATIIAHRNNIPLQITDDLIEIDCGTWTGKKFDILREDNIFNLFNNNRLHAQIPEGEMIIQVQSRMVHCVEMLLQKEYSSVALVSHGDPIKALIAFYIGIPINSTVNMEINPGSITLMTIDNSGSRLLFCNRLP